MLLKIQNRPATWWWWFYHGSGREDSHTPRHPSTTTVEKTVEGVWVLLVHTIFVFFFFLHSKGWKTAQNLPAVCRGFQHTHTQTPATVLRAAVGRKKKEKDKRKKNTHTHSLRDREIVKSVVQ